MTDKEIIDLKQKRAKALADARAIHERAAKDKNRGLTTDEVTQYDAFMKERNELDESVQREENFRKLAAKDAEIRTSDLSAAPGGAEPEERKEIQKRQFGAFGKFLRSGLGALNETESRDLQVGTGADGGFLVAPTEWVNQLIKFVDDLVFIRQKATKMTLAAADTLGVPSLDTDPADADWTSELATGTADSSMKFGRRELKPSPLAKRIKLSNKLIRLSGTPIEALVQARLAYKFAISEEKAFLTGNGVGKPLGLFTASNDGIGTARDVVCGSTTAPTGAGLISMKFGLKAQYWPKAEWLFHRDVMATIAKLVDNNGQYIFRESLRVGEPNTLLGLPINMSEYSPNTLTTGLYVGLLGDYSNYWIVDALNLQVQRLVELYAETNQTGYIGRAELDGMPVLAEAFVRGKLA